MGEARGFEQGTNWKAKNAASIRLRVGDGRKHPVRSSSVEALSPTQQEQADRLREQERQRFEKERQARQGRARGARREAALDARHAEKDHTPEGWVPANQRGYVDPLSRAADPRPTAPLKKKKFRRGRRELQ